MFYILVALIVFLYFIRRFAPVRYAVYASNVTPLPPELRAEDHWVLGGFLFDKSDGKRIDVSKKFVGHVVGNSMIDCDISSGSMFIADYLDGEPLSELREGDIIVVKEAGHNSQSSLSLRRIRNVDESGMISFFPDSKNVQHPDTSISNAVAVVTHVIDNNWIGNPIQKALGLVPA